MTLRTYLTETINPILNSRNPAYFDVPEFIKENQFIRNLENYMKYERGGYEILPRFTLLTIPDNTLTSYECTTLLAANAYMLNTLYATTQQEYNPIDNYNMTEVEEIKNSGVDSAQQTAGERTHKENMGNTHETLTSGTRDDVTTYGNTQTTTINSVSPENNNTFYNDRKSVDTGEQHTDTLKKGAETDERRADSVINTFTDDSYTDESSLTHGHNINRKLTRKGNIGVTTTQQMLTSERELAYFNIYKVISDLIVAHICCRVWDCF